MIDYTKRLIQLLSPQEVLDLAKSIEPYCIDQRKRFYGQAIAVVQPKSIEAIQKTIQFCQQHQISLVPQGGNTGLCGAATPKQSGLNIIVCMRLMNKIRQVSIADNSITVEAGITLQEVQHAAKNVDRFFPLSLASEGSCQIGGNIACNAGGLTVIRYGTMKDLILGLEVILPNGQLISHLSPLRKNTTGFNLEQLFVGSEGRLGIITAATLKLFARAKTTITAWVGLESIEQAIELLALCQSCFAERLSSFELISHEALQLSIRLQQSNKQPEQAKWHILLELTDSMHHLSLEETLLATLSNKNFNQVILAKNESEHKQLWRLREWISEGQRSLGTSIKHDISLPISQIGPFIQSCQQRLATLSAIAKPIIFGHLGDGSLHYNVFIEGILDQRVYEFENEINQIVYEQVYRFNGSIAAEHGIGQLKSQWLNKPLHEQQLLDGIKHLLDPDHLFNPQNEPKPSYFICPENEPYSDK